MNTASAERKYTLEDLRVGMEVNRDELSEIYDTWIILYRPKGAAIEHDGIIGFIGSRTNGESDRLYTADNIVTPVYNDSMNLEADIYYDE